MRAADAGTRRPHQDSARAAGARASAAACRAAARRRSHPRSDSACTSGANRAHHGAQRHGDDRQRDQHLDQRESPFRRPRRARSAARMAVVVGSVVAHDLRSCRWVGVRRPAFQSRREAASPARPTPCTDVKRGVWHTRVEWYGPFGAASSGGRARKRAARAIAQSATGDGKRKTIGKSHPARAASDEDDPRAAGSTRRRQAVTAASYAARASWPAA